MDQSVSVTRRYSLLSGASPRVTPSPSPRPPIGQRRASALARLAHMGSFPLTKAVCPMTRNGMRSAKQGVDPLPHVLLLPLPLHA